MNIWEMRIISEDDQTEVGMRVSCALYAENRNDEKTSCRMIVFRAKDAAAQQRRARKNA